MEIVTLLEIFGGVALAYCGAIFVLSAGMFFLDRKTARKQSARPLDSDPTVEEERDRRAA